jgi:hypothetical protein
MVARNAQHGFIRAFTAAHLITPPHQTKLARPEGLLIIMAAGIVYLFSFACLSQPLVQFAETNSFSR